MKITCCLKSLELVQPSLAELVYAGVDNSPTPGYSVIIAFLMAGDSGLWETVSFKVPVTRGMSEGWQDLIESINKIIDVEIKITPHQKGESQ